MKKLFIDTTSNKEVIIVLTIDNKTYKIKKDISLHKAQIILPLIIETLKFHKLSIKDLNEVKVNPGPGSFTGTRVGISVANAISYALKIPVNGKILEKDSSLVFPNY